VDTLPSPSWTTAADWMPMAQAATARITYWAQPAGREPVTSQPTRTPVSSVSSAASVSVMCAGQCSPAGSAGDLAEVRSVRYLPISVPAATPAT
jgi:hypothetical protein